MTEGLLNDCGVNSSPSNPMERDSHYREQPRIENAELGWIPSQAQ
ncbi:hypothetical protein [Sporisorium scitamineum]|uniref:Uncharacterized protein n=1 Tax=Sporisorium scitamineum TaxID=49012 RepID=A0A0F7SC71_9BASI|nr:hypothetical protein [Sporisorium scitamineum]